MFYLKKCWDKFSGKPEYNKKDNYCIVNIISEYPNLSLFMYIFVSNAINNCLLPAQVTETEADTLIAAAPLSLSIDVLSQSISAEGYEFKFKLDPALCTKLVNGWDDVDLTASYEKKIRAFKKNRQLEAPWLWTSTP